MKCNKKLKCNCTRQFNTPKGIYGVTFDGFIFMPCISEKIYKAFPGLLDLSKTSIANEAFKNQKSQRKINDIIHPAISDLILERINDKKKSHTLFVIDAALIIESGVFKKHRESGSKLILISADKDSRLQRALERSNLSEQTINDRMKLQMKDSEKIKHVDYVIENNSTKSELYNSVDKIIKTIMHE